MEIQQAVEAFRSRFSGQPQAVSYAPGRLNVIGEHTDYNGGFVLPMALDCGVALAFRGRADGVVRVYSAEFDEWLEADASAPFRRTGTWRDYLLGSLAVVRESGAPACRGGTGAGRAAAGMDIVVCGDVPIGAGLSSSAAFGVAAVLAFLHASGARMEPLEVARMAQRAENEYVGVRCGIMDQFTSVHAEPGAALFLDCRALSYRLAPLGGRVSIVVLDTTVRHALGSEYNERRAACEAAARKLLGTAGLLRDVGAETLEAGRTRLTDTEYRRARHVLAENERVLRFVQALESKDYERAGALMFASHASLRDDYEVSCRELDAMVEAAAGWFRANPGSGFGARMTGGGFGGCTVNLLAKSHEARFIEAVLADYRMATGCEGRGWLFQPAGAARVVPLANV